MASFGCRRLLREEVTSGRLDAATSKAAVLQQLCDRLKFNPEAAGALHRSLYRQKMDDVLKNHNKITGRLDHPLLAGFFTFGWLLLLLLHLVYAAMLF